MPHPNAEINQLLTDIEYYDDPNDPAQMYMKALTLLKLWRAANQGIYDGTILPGDIINAFSRAITLDSTSALYIAERCQFYVELAMADYQRARAVPKNPLLNLSFARTIDTILSGVEEKLKVNDPALKQPRDEEKEAITTCAQAIPEAFTHVSSVPQALFAAPVAPKNEREINELTAKISRPVCGTHPASLNQRGQDYMKLASLTQESRHIVSAIEWYSLAIKHEETEPLYYMYRGSASLKLGKVYDAVVDTLTARKLPSARPTYHAYVCNMTKQFVIDLKKLVATESFQLDSKQLDSEGKISIQDPHWIDNLELQIKPKVEGAAMAFK